MPRMTKHLIALAAVLSTAACSDLLNTSENTIALSPAFQTIPMGFSANSNSFDALGDAGLPFMPESMVEIGFHGDNRGPGSGDDDDRRGDDKEDRDRHDGFGRGGIRGILMGGGLGPDFIGAIAFGKGRGRGPFGVFNLPDGCTFSDASGRVTCPPRERHGLIVNVSFAFKDEAGNAQPKFDTVTTDLVNVQVDVNGTKTREHDDDDDDLDDDDDRVTSTLSHKSDRTVEGLAKGSTERVINGTAEAHENTEGTREGISFSAEREAFDTTSNLVIPIRDGHPTLPSAGTVIRSMKVTIAKEGKEPRTKFRREKITFDGTNVIKIEITQDDVTKNCTLTVPEKKISCE
jgi:hypothetical protein